MRGYNINIIFGYVVGSKMINKDLKYQYGIWEYGGRKRSNCSGDELKWKQIIL